MVVRLEIKIFLLIFMGSLYTESGFFAILQRGCRGGLYLSLFCATRDGEDRVGVVYKRGKERGGLWKLKLKT